MGRFNQAKIVEYTQNVIEVLREVAIVSRQFQEIRDPSEKRARADRSLCDDFQNLARHDVENVRIA